MEDFKKLKRRFKFFTIALGLVAVFFLICTILLEFASDALFDAVAYVFCALFGLVIIFLGLVLFLYWKKNKQESKLVEYLNTEISDEFQYQGILPILDIVEESQFSYEKGMGANSKDGISGVIEGIEFDSYLMFFYKDSFLQNTRKNTYELYIFKNIDFLQKDFILTNQEAKLPQDICFISVQRNTLYVYKHTQRKNALYLEALNIEDFKQRFSDEIEKVKQTYEEAKPWMQER